MSSYYTRYCEQHGDWEQDIDRPGDECPECEKAGTTPMQLKDKRIAALVGMVENQAQVVAELEAKLDEYELLHRCDCCDCLTEDAVDTGDNMQCPSCSALWKATARAKAAEAKLAEMSIPQVPENWRELKALKEKGSE